MTHIWDSLRKLPNINRGEVIRQYTGGAGKRDSVTGAALFYAWTVLVPKE